MVNVSIVRLERSLTSKVKFTLIFLAMIFFIFSVHQCNLYTIRAAEVKPTLYIKIYRIQEVDEIEGFLQGGADWDYIIYVWDGNQWLRTEYECPSNTDDIVVNRLQSYQVEIVSVNFEIILWELEPGNPDLADISGYTGGGVDGYSGGTVPRGAQYYGAYNLISNTLTGDYTVSESGYYKTSGDYDGSVSTDQNDANLWFTIYDNYDPPTARAGNDVTTYTDEKVNFAGTNSIGSSGSSLVKYEWDFENDGIIDSMGATTSYTYTRPGTYTVTLKVTDSIGVTDTDTCRVTVRSRGPQASFTYTPENPSIKDTVHLYDTSIAQDGSITKWSWNFGDGTTSTMKDTTHVYSDKGRYTVTLTVTDSYQNTDSYQKTITIINLPPEAEFTFTPTTAKIGREIQFTDQSTDPEERTLRYSWDFGDGFTSTVKDPKHSFVTQGTKTITLTVYDDENLYNRISKTIQIIPNVAPVSDFTYPNENLYVNQDIQFTERASDSDGHIVTWSWSFGDGTTSTTKTPVHRYTQTGEYSVTLTVTDDDDATHSKTYNIEIKQQYTTYILIGGGVLIVGALGYYFLKKK